MLKFFRDQKDSWLVKGILILTAMSFMSLFGIQGISEMRRQNKPVIKLDGRVLTTQEFLNEYNQKTETLRRLSNGVFSAQDALDGGLLVRTLNEMASRAVMETVVEKLNLSIPEDAVREAVRSMPVFMGVDGEFSMTLFNEYLKNMGKTENQFIREMFLQMQAGQLLQAAKAATVVPNDIAKTMYRLQGEKRVVDAFRIDPDFIQINRKPTAEEVQAAYEEMTENLVAPEYRTITAMKLTVDDVAKKIKISDEELQEAFNENKAAYTIEEIRNVDQMLFITEEEANVAADALKKGQSFEKVAQEIAKQTLEQTQLGDITPSTATGDWSEAVFAAKKGEIVGPVQTTFGWQILRVNKITPKIEKSFAQIRRELENKMKMSAAFDTMTELSVAIDDRLGAGEKLEAVAQSEGLAIKTYKLVDSTGVDQKGKAVDLPKSMLAVAFISEAGQDSPMIEDDNAYYVIRVDEIREPAVKTLEEAKPEVLAAWTAQQQKVEAKKIAQSIEDRLKKGEKPAVIAQTKNVSYEQLPAVSRFETKLPQATVYALFAKPNGSVISTPANGKYIVARSVKVVPADPENDILGVSEMRRQLTEDAAEGKADTALAAFGENYHLTIKEDAVKDAFAMITNSAKTEADY